MQGILFNTILITVSPSDFSMLSIKQGVEKSQVVTMIRIKISFNLLQSMILCLRGFCIANTRNKNRIDTELKSTFIQIIKKSYIIF